MPAALSPMAALVWWSVMGLCVGSFLNVAIHRLPLDGESIRNPRRSRCPKCRTPLSWKDNLPLVSWLALRGRCRHCSARISVRYPLVELLTAGLWCLAALAPGPGMLVLVHVVVLSGLVVATFVDFDYYEIPDEVSLGGIFLAPVAALLVPELHAETWVAGWASAGDGVDRFGSLIGCLAGMATGWGVLWVIGRVGSRVAGTEAMGFGDVKLLAAGGGFIGPGGVVLALLIAAFAGSIVGVGNMARLFVLTHRRAQARGRHQRLSKALRVARIAGRYLPFGPYLALGIGIVLLYWHRVSVFLF